MAELDSSVPVSDFQTLETDLSRILAYPRLRAVLLGIFAGFALLLASIGLYGVLAQGVAQRNREVGIRMALGAQKREVLTLVLKQGVALALAGILAGLAASWLLTRLIAVFLYGVKPADPWMLAAASIALLLIAAVSTYLPARRAASIDPATVLRYE
jgi:putative ABC transport system permease protein